MSKVLEPAVWIAVLVILGGLNLIEGRRHQALAASLPLGAEELYRTLARSKVHLQIVDARPDLQDSYEDAHIPGSIPFPGCDAARTPAAANEQLLSSAPTVLVLPAEGGEAAARCRSFFSSARVLAGGMEAWAEANYPEEPGEYSPPRTSAGGGCL